MTAPLRPWSAGSYAIPPRQVLEQVGIERTVCPDRVRLRKNDLIVTNRLSDRLLEHVPEAACEQQYATLSDPTGREYWQQRNGLAGEILHPDPGLASVVAAVDDKKLAVDICAAFNAWLADFVSTAPERHVGVGLIPPTGLRDALEALRTCQTGGLRGASLLQPPAGRNTAPGGDSMAFWQQAQATVICLGPNFGSTVVDDQPRIAAGRAPASSGFLTRMAFAGVADEAPNVRVQLTNVEVGWLPYNLEVADTNYERAAASRTVSLRDPQAKPSEYVRRFTWATVTADRFGVLARSFMGEHHLVWSTPFPMTGSNFPDDEQSCDVLALGLPEEAQRRLSSENCRRLYGLPGVVPFSVAEIDAFDQYVTV